MTENQTNTRPPEPDPELKKRSRVTLIKYGLARLGLFLALTVILQGIVMLLGLPVPLMISALLALFLALPLSMLMFSKLRVEATQTLAQYSQQRKEHKAWVKSELAGR